MSESISQTLAHEIYESLREELEAKHFGKFVQINSVTREYVTGGSRAEARQLYNEQFGDVPSCSAQVGHLPTLSSEAQAILARLRNRPRAPDGYDDNNREPDLVVKRSPPREQVIGLRPTEKLVPSVRDAVDRHLSRRGR